MTKDDIKLVFEYFKSKNPKPETELEFSNAYECLIAVMLSAQTTDIQVNKVTKKLFAKANNPQKMLELGEENIKEIIRHIGLFRNKAKNAVLLSAQLIEKHNNEVPNDLELLQDLPGVGRKTALVVLNAIFGENTLAVDTHVQRVSNRIGLVKDTKNPLQTERSLLKVVPNEYLYYAHHWLILHGRYICKSRRPECKECGLKDLCSYYKTTADK